MKNKTGLISGIFLGASVAMTSLPVKSEEPSKHISNIRCGIDNTLKNNINLESSSLSDLLLKKIKTDYDGCFSQEQIDLLKQVVSDKEFLDKLDEINKKNQWNDENIIKVIIFALIYLISYLPTIISTYKGKYLNAFSFAGFATASGGAALVNGLVPGSLVLSETFILALTALGIYFRNKIIGKVYEEPELLEFFNNIPFPLSRYNKTGKPIIWNKKLEEITGYSHKEVLEYFEEKGEILTLLYEGEELEKVKKYLSSLKEGGGYVDEPFTLKTKSGEKITLNWTSFSSGNGGRYSFAREIGDDLEFKVLQKLFDNFPYPVSKYDETGKPIIWNKKLEEITGYSHKEVLEYFEEKGEINTLLYKGKNLERVQEYLLNVDTTGGYSNVAFTLNAKDGKEVTLLWTTIPDGQGGTLRTSVELTRKNEIQVALKKRDEEIERWKKRAELLESQTILLKNVANTCPLTGLLNTNGLGEFLKGYNRNLYSIVTLDLDFFKLANDNVGHDFGDLVLKAFGFFLKKSLRDSDVAIRPHGDEFFAFLDFCNTQNAGIVIDNFRSLFSSVVFFVSNDGKISAICNSNNKKHQEIFTEFIKENQISLLEKTINILPGDIKMENGGKYFCFSASCGISSGINKGDFDEKFKSSDELLYFVKSINFLQKHIQELLAMGILTYETLTDGSLVLKNSSGLVLISINNSEEVNEKDVKNGVAYYLFDEYGKENGLKIFRGERVFTFTKEGLAFYEYIKNESKSGER